MADGRRRAVVRGRGHPQLRASHDKTLEFTRETDVSARATCVVGVDADFDADAVGLLRGPVDLVLTAGGHEARGTAVINPDHRVGARLVLRRSRHADPDTLALGATLTAGDLTPAFAAALADPDAEVRLVVTESDPPPPLVLVRAAGHPEPPGRAGLFWRYADATLALGGTRPADPPPPTGVVAATLPPPGEPLTRAGWLAAAARLGARFAGPDPLTSALLAAGLPPAPALWLGRVDERGMRRPEPVDVVRNAAAPVVLTAARDEAAAVLDRLRAAAPGRRIATPDGRLDLGTALVRTAAGGWPTAEVVMVIEAGPADAARIDLDALVRALAAAGVAPRTLGEALKPFGLTRRRVYDVLGGSG